MHIVPSRRGLSLATMLACSLLAAAALADCVDYDEFPAVVGSIEQQAVQLQYYGDDYLLAANDTGLIILVLDDAGSPSLLASVPLGDFGVLDLAVCGTVVYCLSYSELYAVDLSDVASPVLIGQIELDGSHSGIGGEGDLLGVVDNDDTWSLYDTTNPALPQLLHSQASVSIPGDVVITDQRAILIGNGWELHDITVPSSPVPIASEVFDYVYEDTYAAGTSVRSCALHGDSLVQYLDEWTRYGDFVHGAHFTHGLTLRTVDVAIPGNPVVTHEEPLGSSQAWPIALQAVLAVADDLAFVNCGGLRIYDLSGGLAHVATIPTDAVGDGLVARDGFVHGGYTRITTFTYPQPLVDNRVVVGPSGADEAGTTNHAVAGDGWFAATDWWENSDGLGTIYGGALWVFATSSPAEPVAEFGGDWISYSDVAADGASLYFVENEQLKWIDLTDPANPGEPTAIPLGYVAQTVEAGPGDLVAVGGSSGGLRIYDLADPGAPQLVGNLTSTNIQDLLWQGDLLLAGTTQGITVFDVQDPAAPAAVSTLAIGTTRAMSALDATSLLACNETAIYLIDIANPADPEVLAVNMGVGPIAGFVAIGETVYVGNRGVHALKLPTLVDIGVLATEPTVGPLLWTEGHLLGCRLHGPGAGEVPTHCGSTVVEDPDADGQLPLPVAVVPLSAAPNPFNPRTEVRFTTPQSGSVRVAAYDLRGRMVRRLVDGALAAGVHAVEWDGRDDAGHALPSGTYLLRLSSEQELSTTKVMLLE